MIQRTRIALDEAAIQRFARRELEAIALPKSLREESRLNREELDRLKIKPQSSHPRRPEPIIWSEAEEQYNDAKGTIFSWGHILERRANQFVIWDFCLTHLLSRYLRLGLRLRDLQRIVFAEIEASVPYTSRDPVMAVSLTDGWVIYPGTAVGVFTQVVHFAAEAQARDWTAQILIDNVLPKVIERARNDAESPSH